MLDRARSGDREEPRQVRREGQADRRGSRRGARTRLDHDDLARSAGRRRLHRRGDRRERRRQARAVRQPRRDREARRHPRLEHVVDLDHRARRGDEAAGQGARHALHESGAADDAGRGDSRPGDIGRVDADGVGAVRSARQDAGRGGRLPRLHRQPHPDADDQRGDLRRDGRRRHAGGDRRGDEARHESPDGTADARRLHRPRRLPGDPRTCCTTASAIRNTARVRCCGGWSRRASSGGSPARAFTRISHNTTANGASRIATSRAIAAFSGCVGRRQQMLCRSVSRKRSKPEMNQVSLNGHSSCTPTAAPVDRQPVKQQMRRDGARRTSRRPGRPGAPCIAATAAAKTPTTDDRGDAVGRRWDGREQQVEIRRGGENRARDGEAVTGASIPGRRRRRGPPGAFPGTQVGGPRHGESG